MAYGKQTVANVSISLTFSFLLRNVVIKKLICRFGPIYIFKDETTA